MSSRSINDLAVEMRPMARNFFDKCARRGIEVLITCTYRSGIEQNALYAQGRTKPGRIVTWAKAGQSKHNTMHDGLPASRAFDVVPLRGGKPVWGTGGNGIDDDPSDDDTDDLELWQRIGEIGKSVGLLWAGDWPKGKREFPHFEMPEGV